MRRQKSIHLSLVSTLRISGLEPCSVQRRGSERGPRRSSASRTERERCHSTTSGFEAVVFFMKPKFRCITAPHSFTQLLEFKFRAQNLTANSVLPCGTCERKYVSMRNRWPSCLSDLALCSGPDGEFWALRALPFPHGNLIDYRLH